MAWALATTPLSSAEAHPGKAHRHSGQDHARQANDAPTPEQIKKRLNRVMKRAVARKRQRKQRRRDRRRALKKRLHKRLDAGPITPEITSELKTHARRVARLRQIRFMAAKNDDFETVEATDKALARENARHERWWRSALAYKAKPPKTGAPKK